MRVIGYARVSSKDQSLDIQIEELQKFCQYRGFELVRIFTDKVSGKDLERTGFKDMMTALHKGSLGAEGLVVYKIDRIGRNIRNLLSILDDLSKLHIQFISVSDNIDTTSPQGALMFNLIASFAEYERLLINERTSLGIKSALEKGIRFGRPKKKVDMDIVLADIAAGIPKLRVCKKYGFGKTFLYSQLEILKNKNQKF
jgi:DNA invertase Pin-like site-specific DNA recombinase